MMQRVGMAMRQVVSAHTTIARQAAPIFGQPRPAALVAPARRDVLGTYWVSVFISLSSVRLRFCVVPDQRRSGGESGGALRRARVCGGGAVVGQPTRTSFLHAPYHTHTHTHTPIKRHTRAHTTPLKHKQ